MKEAGERADEVNVNLNLEGGSKGSLTGNGSSTFGGKAQKTLTDQLKKMVGIDVGIGALLKQSQIFTGYLGNLFAIVGALIDTILAPLAPLAFKSLAKLGAIIPKLADMAAKYIPKILKWGEKVAKDVDKFFKMIFQKDYAGKILKALLWLVGINISIRMMMLTGKAGGTILGLRQGGVLNMAARGTSRLLGGGGGLSRIGGALMAPITGAAALGGRLLGRGGGGAGGTTTGGGGGGFMGRLFSGRGGAPSQAQWNANARLSGGGRWQYPAGAVVGGENVGGKFAAGPASGVAGAGRLSRIMGRFGNLAKMGKGIPILGTAISAVYGYSGGRDQGMSVGMSAARGGATVGGAVLGGAIGSLAGPLGTIGGAALGAWAGGGLFDMLFGKKGGGGGDGPWNMDIGGQVGAAGYQAPFFIAEAQEYWSDQVRKSGMVIDEFTLALAVAKQMALDEANAREAGIDSMDDSITGGAVGFEPDLDKKYGVEGLGKEGMEKFYEQFEPGSDAAKAAMEQWMKDTGRGGETGMPNWEDLEAWDAYRKAYDPTADGAVVPGGDVDPEGKAAAAAAAANAMEGVEWDDPTTTGAGGFDAQAAKDAIDRAKAIQDAQNEERRLREQAMDDMKADDSSAFKTPYKPWDEAQAAQDAQDKAKAIQDALNVTEWEDQEQYDRDENERILQRDREIREAEQHLQDTQFRAQNILEERKDIPQSELLSTEDVAAKIKELEADMRAGEGVPFYQAASEIAALEEKGRWNDEQIEAMLDMGGKDQEASEIGGASMAKDSVLEANRVAEENRLALEAWRAELYKDLPSEVRAKEVQADFNKAEEVNLMEQMSQTLFKKADLNPPPPPPPAPDVSITVQIPGVEDVLPVATKVAEQVYNWRTWNDEDPWR
jgi:hypothetical protein